MLTLNNLKAFYEDLKIIQIETEELLKVRSEEKLFKSSDDYFLALKTCNYYPQDFFKLRLFDYEICLKHDNKRKLFYIHIESTKGLDYTNYELTDFIKKYEIKTNVYNTSLYIPKNKKFNECLKIFIEFLFCFLKFYNSKDKLFDYELC